MAIVKRLYQFKITLKDIEPLIWRRILVPESYTFWDLHVAIQDAMGWWDYHLHEFRIKPKHAHSFTRIGIPSDDFEEKPPLPGWSTPLADFFPDVGVSCIYEYDFGDGWEHELLLEGILLREKGRKHPECLDGARCCPPEDCGGVHGYHRYLEAISDPEHEDHEDLMQWRGDYDPEKFIPAEVQFSNPKTRLRKSFDL